MKKISLLFPTLLAVLSLCAPTLAEEPAEDSPFDAERQVWLFDTDQDSFPDLTEELGGTDPLDPEDFPGSLSGEVAASPAQEKVGFPTGQCREGFIRINSRLCITPKQNNREYSEAAAICRIKHARVCTYEDLSYLYLTTGLDRYYNPKGLFLGDWVADDTILCGNKSITSNNDPDILNFEGTCNKRLRRQYWCCHDRT